MRGWPCGVPESIAEGKLQAQRTRCSGRKGGRKFVRNRENRAWLVLRARQLEAMLRRSSTHGTQGATAEHLLQVVDGRRYATLLLPPARGVRGSCRAATESLAGRLTSGLQQSCTYLDGTQSRMDACACNDFVIKPGSGEAGWLSRRAAMPAFRGQADAVCWCTAGW
jgi:hypothetical protein